MSSELDRCREEAARCEQELRNGTPDVMGAAMGYMDWSNEARAIEAEESAAGTLKAPFPWFGGKSKVADVVWDRFGDVENFVDPFAGSLAVLLSRPHHQQTETVNDIDCVAPSTRILKADLTWAPADAINVGDELIGFDEKNGEPRAGLRAPKKYRRLAKATVTAVRRLRKPCYRLTFGDGTAVVSSATHLWLGGSHQSGGRGWRWQKTESLVCNRKNQRSWVLKVANVIEREESWEAGWLGGLLDGEGTLVAGPGVRVSLSQNEGPTLAHAEALLKARGFKTTRVPNGRTCRQILITGGIVETLSLLMRFKPLRLIQKLIPNLRKLSLYGRQHRAVGLVSKEFLGEQEVIAIETDCRTFIAEGLASHNCYLSNFWRALQHDPATVAHWADYPVNEADLHARHLWLVNREEFRERMKTDHEFYDPKIAGYWVWGISQWIGSGWCARPEWTGRTNAARHARGIFRTWQQIPLLRGDGAGVHRKIPHLGDAGRGVNRPHQKRPMCAGANDGKGVHRQHLLPEKRPLLSGRGQGCGVHADRSRELFAYFEALAARLRRVRVCCGDWKRVLGPSVTIKHGITGIFLDPPYDMRVVSNPDTGRDGAAPSDKLYNEHDNEISAAVREWALENGNNPLLRIALCGYDDEHGAAMPPDWECVAWKAAGGYGAQAGNHNGARERVWFSKSCRRLQPGLFDEFLYENRD